MAGGVDDASDWPPGGAAGPSLELFTNKYIRKYFGEETNFFVHFGIK